MKQEKKIRNTSLYSLYQTPMPAEHISSNSELKFMFSFVLSMYELLLLEHTFQLTSTEALKGTLLRWIEETHLSLWSATLTGKSE